MVKQFLKFVILITVLSCNKNNSKVDIANKEEVITSTGTMNNLLNNKKYMDSLRNKFIAKGDTTAYKEARNIYFIAEEKTGFLFYSLLMSNKYNYKSSCYDIYFILTTSDKNKLDKETSKMAEYYLFKAYKNGSINAKRVIEKMNTDNPPPASASILLVPTNTTYKTKKLN